jgi:hypothetical protein
MFERSMKRLGILNGGIGRIGSLGHKKDRLQENDQ